MTEQEWLDRNDAETMLKYMETRATDRKVRLFAIACCRQRPKQLTSKAAQTVVANAERLADGEIPFSGLNYPQDSTAHLPVVEELIECDGYTSAERVISCLRADCSNRVFRRFAGILRDIFGNPFRPVSVSPKWLTPTVLDLAQATYEERILPAGELDTGRLAVLSDALVDEGCNDAALLDHLRLPGPHVRGCWAVDLILGKS